ncbi:MAG: type I restriction-modification system subunit M [Acidimicrobiales bacterium]
MGKRSTTTVAEEIFAVEGFQVRFIPVDAEPGSYVDPYEYERAAASGWTVKKWRESRWNPNYPEYGVEVLNPDGNPVHGKTLLSTLRASYKLVDAESSEGADADDQTGIADSTERPPKSPSAESQSPRSSRSASSPTTEPLGFEGELWKAADKLRGSMDSSEYKHVVLGLVFLKYIDDAFTERRDKLASDLTAEGFAGDDLEELLESRDEYTAQGVFWVPPEARWGYLKDNAKQPGIGKMIDNAMDLVEADNPTLRGVLPKNFSRPALDVRRLGELVDLVSGIGLGSSEHREKDILGRVYEYFLGRFASAEGKGGGEFYTPRSVVKLLVEMIEPYGGRIYDPCCGSGGMFVQSEAFVTAHGGQRNDIAVYGQELNDTTWRMAKMNLAIRGIEADLGPRWGDTFHDDLHPDLKADYVLANPPFNISDWGGDQLRDDARWKYGVPPAGNANFAWLEHMASKLSPRGVAGVVLANGSLSSQQSGEGQIRKAMVEGDLVECIVAMPGQLFYSTPIAVCLWFLNRDKSASRTRHGAATCRDRRGEVLFIDCGNVGTMADRTHRELSSDDIAMVADTFHAWRGEPDAGDYENTPGFCASATIEQIQGHRFVLTPGRYVGTETIDADDEPFAEKIVRLRSELYEAFTHSDELEAAVRRLLDAL